MTEWLNKQQAASRLGVSPRTIARRITDGTLPGYRLGGRLIRVRAEDVDALITPIPIPSQPE